MWVLFRTVMLVHFLDPIRLIFQPFVLVRIVRVADCAAAHHCGGDLNLGTASAVAVIVLSLIETFLVYAVWFLMVIVHSCSYPFSFSPSLWLGD